MPYKTNGTQTMIIFYTQLLLFILFISYVGKLITHLLIDNNAND